MLLSSSSLIVGVVLIILSVAQSQNLTSPCTSLNEVFSHPTDCTRYIQCIWGQPLDRPCAPGTFFSFSFKVCVFPWNKTADTCLKTQDSVVTTCKNYPTALFASPIKCNQYYNCSGHSTLIRFPPVSGQDSDDFYRFECPFPQLFSDVTMRCEDYQNVQCGQRFEPLGQYSVFERCTKYPTAVFPHPTNCHQYYDCTGNSYFPKITLMGGRYSENYYQFECVYPQVFNEVTLQCDDYQNVECGVRFQPLDKCEYTVYMCYRPAFCRPCSIPSCRGLPDGMNVYKGKEWTSSFIVCEDQRLLSLGHCSEDRRLNISQIFSPDLGKCVTTYEIPNEHGGSFFNCVGRPDGLYPDDVTGKPNLYFRCTFGALVLISLCPVSQYFDQRSSSCLARV